MNKQHLWKTYNFEVEEHHTYIADGIRVHNNSYPDGRSGAAGQVGDPTDDDFSGKLGVASDNVGGLFGGFADAGAVLDLHFGKAAQKFSEGNILGGIWEVGVGIARAIGEVVQGAFEAVGNIVSGIGNAISSVFGARDDNNGQGDDKAKPIILDLDGDGVEVSVNGHVSFDMDGDGYLENTNWVGPDDAFLVIDLNADGSRGRAFGRYAGCVSIVLKRSFSLSV